MAERDKIIKGGQITWPRLLFLAAVGLFVFLMVSAEGGKYLAIGYWVLTLAICGLLFIIAIDYGIKMEAVELHHGHPAPISSASVTSVTPACLPSAPPTDTARARAFFSDLASAP